MGKRSAVSKRLHSTARVKRLVDSYGDDVLAVKHVKSLRSAAIHFGIDAQDIRDLRDSLFDSSKTQTFLKTIRSGCISRRGGTLCFGSGLLLPEGKKIKKEAGRASTSSTDIMFPVIDMVEACQAMEGEPKAEIASLKDAILDVAKKIKSLPTEDLELLSNISQKELNGIVKDVVTELNKVNVVSEEESKGHKSDTETATNKLYNCIVSDKKSLIIGSIIIGTLSTGVVPLQNFQNLVGSWSLISQKLATSIMPHQLQQLAGQVFYHAPVAYIAKKVFCAISNSTPLSTETSR